MRPVMKTKAIDPIAPASTICHAWNSTLFSGPLMFPEGDGGGGGGGDGDKEEKTFTQSEVEAMIERRLGKERKKFADYDQLKEQVAALPKLTEELEALKASLEDKGKDDGTKALNALQRERDRLARELEEKAKEVEAAAQVASMATANLDGYVMRQLAQKALLEKGALPSAVDQATRLMLQDGSAALEWDEGDNGARVNPKLVLQIGGMQLDDPATAAEQYLKTNPHFSKAAGGGSGGGRPSGGVAPEDMHKLPTSSRIAAGLGSE